MIVNTQDIIKSGQEQAVASWINYLNQLRLDALTKALADEKINWQNAAETLDQALETIKKDIVNNGKGRGGKCGMHGFIAEVAECGIGNARKQVEGKIPDYRWINDNGPADLFRGAAAIQQKFVNSGNHLSLEAIKQSLKAYPDFVKNGGKYQIPSDHYERIQWLLSIPKDRANKMATSTGDFSLKQWQEVHDFFDSNTVPKEALEPSLLDYKSVQQNTYEKTFHNERKSLYEKNEQRRKQAYQKSKPSLHEGAKATVVAAALEGATGLAEAIIRKRKKGKKLFDFSQDDWTEIGKTSGSGFIKGGIRGFSIYMLSNYTATPAAVANSLVTASFGVAEQAHLYRTGKISELQLIEHSESLCMETAVSALSSTIGQIVIPVPVLGAMIGNTAGSILYKIVNDSMSEKEQKLIELYLEEIEKTKSTLDDAYQRFINDITDKMNMFLSVLDTAFAPDIHIAFSGSVELAKLMGVPYEEILDSPEKIEDYFLN